MSNRIMCAQALEKVKSAFHLAEAIRQVQPDLVLNMGSAGTVNHQVGDIFCLP